MSLTYVKYRRSAIESEPAEQLGETPFASNIVPDDFSHGRYVEVESSLSGGVTAKIHNWAEWSIWIANQQHPKHPYEVASEEELPGKGQIVLPKDTEFAENYNEKGDGAHYQAFFAIETDEIGEDGELVPTELQWLETACRKEPFRTNPDMFKGAVLLQVQKYQDRLGQKDEELQELTKSLWYLKFLTAWVKNGYQPILVRDIDDILAR